MAPQPGGIIDKALEKTAAMIGIRNVPRLIACAWKTLKDIEMLGEKKNAEINPIRPTVNN